MQTPTQATATQAVVPLPRLLPGLVIGPASWLGPYIAAVSLFLPAMIAMLDEEHKIELVATFATAAMIVAAISNMVAGALSDRTRTRWGKRTPWIVLGAFAFMLAMVGAAMAPNVPLLLTAWLFGQAALNFIVAPMVAWIDMAPVSDKGTASSVYGGLGMALGNNGFSIFAAMLLGQFRLGFVIFGAIAFVGVVVATLIVREPSNLDEQFTATPRTEKQRVSLRSLATVFPAWSQGRDYYLALLGKLFQGVGNFAVMGYLLYIMTDFMGLSTEEATFPIQLINMIMLGFGVAMGFLAGPLADRFNVLKWPVAFSAVLLGIGALGMYFLQGYGGIWVYGIAAGLGMGLWNSLDNYLNLRVIPDKSRVAFFLGVYNLGNTLTQAIAPVLAAVVISMFGFSSIFLMSFAFAMVGGLLIASIRSVRR